MTPSHDLVSHHNNILLSPLIALTYHLVPDGLFFRYTKPYSSIIGNQLPTSHVWEVHQLLFYLLRSVLSIILLQFWYLLTNILFVEVCRYLIRSYWESKSLLKASQFARWWLGHLIANLSLGQWLAWLGGTVLNPHKALDFWDHYTDSRRHGLLDATNTAPWCLVNPIAAREVDLLGFNKRFSKWEFRL